MQLLYLTVINKVQRIFQLRPLFIFKNDCKYHVYTKYYNETGKILYYCSGSNPDLDIQKTLIFV